MSKIQAFLITVGLAGAYGLGEAEFGEARAAVADRQKAEVHATLGATQAVAMENLINNNLCDAVNSRWGLSGESACDAAKHAERLCFNWTREVGPPATRTVTVGASFGIDGSWTPGAPE